MAATAWDLETVLRKGTELHQVTVENRVPLESRLEAGLIDGMGADLQSLSGCSTAVITSKTAKEASTKEQNRALEKGFQRVSKLRDSVVAHHPEAADRKNFGIGQRMAQGTVKSVRAGLQAMLNGCLADPAKARAAGILPDDIATLQQLMAALTGADATQEAKKVSAKQTTAERNATHRRVEQAIKKIGAISEIVFEDQPAILARFRSAMPQPRKAGKKKPAATPAPDAK